MQETSVCTHFYWVSVTEIIHLQMFLGSECIYQLVKSGKAQAEFCAKGSWWVTCLKWIEWNLNWIVPVARVCLLCLFICVLNVAAKKTIDCPCFILSDGKLDVFQHNKLLTSITVWTTFGELAILYNCTRTASVRGKEFCIHTVETKSTWELRFYFYLLLFMSVTLWQTWSDARWQKPDAVWSVVVFRSLGSEHRQGTEHTKPSTMKELGNTKDKCQLCIFF